MSENSFFASPTEASTIRCTERVAPGVAVRFDVKTMLHAEQTPFQHFAVMETAYGPHLMCDGRTQVTDRDKYLFHESLVHPAMISHPNPRRVFIGGGTTLATAREVLRHKSVEEVVMVEIDEALFQACQKHLPSFGEETVNDPRLRIEFGDCRTFLMEYDAERNGSFDVIFMDVGHPTENGPANGCYFVDFYQQLPRVMSPQGVLASQLGPGGFDTHDQLFSVIHNSMKAGFRETVAYTAEVPSLSTRWGFGIGFVGDAPDFMNVTSAGVAKKVNDLMKQRVGEKVVGYYDGVSHMHMFALPKYLRVALKNETRVMSAQTPFYIL